MAFLFHGILLRINCFSSQAHRKRLLPPPPPALTGRGVGKPFLPGHRRERVNRAGPCFFPLQPLQDDHPPAPIQKRAASLHLQMAPSARASFPLVNRIFLSREIPFSDGTGISRSPPFDKFVSRLIFSLNCSRAHEGLYLECV